MRENRVLAEGKPLHDENGLSNLCSPFRGAAAEVPSAYGDIVQEFCIWG